MIFRRFGLCRSNSSSLLVGSHVVYFSPMPVEERKCKRRVKTSTAALTGLAEMRYLAISRLSSAPLWQSVPCLYRIYSPDTQNNIFRRITSLSLEGEGEKDWSKITNGFSHTLGFISLFSRDAAAVTQCLLDYDSISFLTNRHIILFHPKCRQYLGSVAVTTYF